MCPVRSVTYVTGRTLGSTPLPEPPNLAAAARATLFAESDASNPCPDRILPSAARQFRKSPPPASDVENAGRSRDLRKHAVHGRDAVSVALRKLHKRRARGIDGTHHPRNLLRRDPATGPRLRHVDPIREVVESGSPASR
jgi:hypothetical protein